MMSMIERSFEIAKKTMVPLSPWYYEVTKDIGEPWKDFFIREKKTNFFKRNVCDISFVRVHYFLQVSW